MLPSPSSNSFRAYTPADLDTLVAVINRAYAGFGMDARTTPAILAHRIAAPGFETTLMIDADGQIIGAMGCDFDPEHGKATSDTNLVPEARTPENIHLMLAQLEARTLELGAQGTPADSAVYVDVFIISTAEDFLGAMRERGWQHVRSTYRMQLPLRDPIDVPTPPDGIAIRAFDRERDTYAVYVANETTFADHWGNIGLSFEEWQHLMLNRPGDDNSMWLVAWDGDQIAGVCLNRPGGTHAPDLAWVGSLGVLKEYRKRGLGEALLKHSFKLFQERGYTRAGLGVDTANATGAVALYERVGMRVYVQFVTYRKVLRAEKD